MVNQIAALFDVAGLQQRALAFCRACLLCLHVKGGKVIPRPWAESVIASERNEALHWDYLFLGDSFEGQKYVLVLKDSATHYTRLVPCAGPTATVAARAMVEWYSQFGLARTWVSDCGTHFRGKVIRELSDLLKAKQSFVLAYCPWQNGSVERVNRDIVQVLRVLLLDYSVNRRDWPYLLPLVQASINHSQVQSLAGHSPIELFTGLVCPTALETVVQDEGLLTSHAPSDDATTKLAMLRTSLQLMHREVHNKKKNWQCTRRCKHKGVPVNFSIGDFVLRSRVDEKRGPSKLLVTWTGPYKVVDADDYAFTVEHLATKERAQVHASRLKFYCDAQLDVTTELIEHVAAQDQKLGIEQIMQHRVNNRTNAIELLVQWKGFETVDDSWEPLSSLMADVPHIVRQYAGKSGDPTLCDAVGSSQQ